MKGIDATTPIINSFILRYRAKLVRKTPPVRVAKALANMPS
jgi:hypothetical protein